MRSITLAILMGAPFAFVHAAIADVTLTYAVADQPAPLVVEYRDDATMRGGRSKNEFAIVNEGALYYCQRSGGRWRVVDVARAADELDQTGLGGIVRQEVSRRNRSVPVEKVTLTDTGKPEVVAGVAGTVYDALVEKEDGSTETHELVMTKDPRALSAWNGFMGVASKNLEAIGDVIDLGVAGIRSAKVLDTFRDAGVAPIRIDDRMRLAKVEETAIADARFKLPAKPVGLVGGGLSELEKILGR